MKRIFKNLYESLRHSQHPVLRGTRQIVGVLMVIGGLFGFMPLVGFWMIPLGLGLLSIDWPIARRAYRWLMSKWRAFEARIKQARQARAARKDADTPDKRNGP